MPKKRSPKDKSGPSRTDGTALEKPQDDMDGLSISTPIAGSEKVGTSKEDWIGSQLKRVYDQALEEPVPEDMLALLHRLDEESGKK